MKIQRDECLWCDRARGRDRGAIWLVIWGIVLPGDALAYIDPGTSGMLSQVLYVMFYSALGVFLYMIRHFKSYLVRAREYFAKLFSHRD